MRLTFVGDIALGDHPKTVGFGFGSRYHLGIPPALSRRLAPPGGGTPDLILGNLEFPLYDPDGERTLTHRQCRGLREYGRFLASAGIGAVNVANNHIFQHGASAFESTVDAVRVAGIHVIGTPADFSDAGTICVSGRRVAILGWSDRPRQYAQETPPYNEFSEHAYAQIAAARRRADVVVASIHWGDEFILLPSERERAIARRMIDSGATFVIGHHPHVIREIEHHAGGVIAYSLGNFIGDMLWDTRTRLTAWLSAEVSYGRVDSATLIPGIIDDDYFPRAIDERDGPLVRQVASALEGERKRLERTGYATVAEAERRRHVRRTGLMMLRSLRRYPPGVAIEMFGGAMSHRLRRALSPGGDAPPARQGTQPSSPTVVDATQQDARAPRTP